MRVLFVVEPLVMHSRPFHYWAWLGYFAKMLRAVEAVGGEGRLVTNEALAARATAPASGDAAAVATHGLPADRVIGLGQAPIRARFRRPSSDIVCGLHHGTFEPAAVRAYGELVRERLGEFEPDVIVSLTPAAHLAAAFPSALVLHAETAAYSRAPFPSCVFFDPRGMWRRSLLGEHAAELAKAVDVTEEERALLATVRKRHAGFFRSTTPFGALEEELRTRHAKLALLPLQFGGEPGFDANAPFRTQGEYLLHVAEHLPKDIGLVVVEHPTAHWVGDIIDDETRAFIGARFPDVTFVDFRAADSAGQYLIHHVDFVVSVSSSLALQALLFEKGLVSVGASHVADLASVRGVEELTREGAAPRRDLDPLLAWMVSRYFVPLDLATDPAWLAPFLHRSLERFRARTAVAAFLDPVAPPGELGARLTAPLDRWTPTTATLTNGNFEDWTDLLPESWELVDLGGTDASVQLAMDDDGRSCAHLERTFAGPEPTLFLQRVPDVTKLAGHLARIRFRARAGAPLALMFYLYGQLADGAPGIGTEPRAIAIGEEWREHAFVLRMPELGARAPLPGHHTEIVFALAPAAGAAAVQLADVHLEPVVF